VPSYLVESYLANSEAAFDDARRRASRAAALGSGVRYVRTTFVPEDQMILHRFEAGSVEALEGAGRLAALPFERIVEVVEAEEPLVGSRPSARPTHRGGEGS